MNLLQQKRLASLVKNVEDFRKLLESGMFWEYFPECDGTYLNFIKLYVEDLDEQN